MDHSVDHQAISEARPDERRDNDEWVSKIAARCARLNPAVEVFAQLGKVRKPSRP